VYVEKLIHTWITQWFQVRIVTDINTDTTGFERTRGGKIGNIVHVFGNFYIKDGCGRFL
jgi:hypothetical protein